MRIRADDDWSDVRFASQADCAINDTFAAGLVPILAKKAEALKLDPQNDTLLEEYTTWWGTAAERYAGVSHRLSFDLMVEPAKDLGSDLRSLNKAHAAACDAICAKDATHRLRNRAVG